MTVKSCSYEAKEKQGKILFLGQVRSENKKMTMPFSIEVELVRIRKMDKLIRIVLALLMFPKYFDVIPLLGESVLF